MSAFTFPDKPLYLIWQAAFNRPYTLITSPPIIEELAMVLRRHPSTWGTQPLQSRLKAVAQIADIVVPNFTLNVITKDPPANRILECAIAGSAHPLVSGNRHLLQLGTYEGIAMIRPRDFMRALGIPEE